MEVLNINKILDRETHVDYITNILRNFEVNKFDLSTKKGIYIYGVPGTGKTTFITNILKELNYDIIKYDAGDIRNKTIIETISKHNMADKNIMSLFHKKAKPLAIIMDEIDGMNNGDKGGINALIKIIRPKKTKKQRLEEVTMNPIICIGNYHMDKKMKELMKVCHIVELKNPSQPQILTLIDELIPNIEEAAKKDIILFIQGDLRKLQTIYEFYKNNNNQLDYTVLRNIFHLKSYNEDTRKITQKLINNHYSLNHHLTIMNETDRTIVGLLWHENIIDVLSKMKPDVSVPFYLSVLHNICFADYIDRITFQKQIWQFNEMSSLIKTFKNNKLYHDSFKKKYKFNPPEIRFTKVLTKYATEYNNYIFIQDLCQQLSMDKKDLFSFFLNLKEKYSDNNEEIIALFENYEITTLDIQRMYRYMEKYTKENISEVNDDISIVSTDE